jgi:diguanylate cyclase (GGDEF)-like protein/PAS domain S-box-containing protein
MTPGWILFVALVGAVLGALGYFAWTKRFALGAGWKVSRNALFEEMSDGVIVLDAQNRIADVNAAALNMLDARDAQWVGRGAMPLEKVIPASLLHSNVPTQSDVEVRNANGEARFLNVRLAPLTKNNPQRGRLMILQDITERKRTEQALERMNRQLQLQLAEIQTLQATLKEQATRDPLTGLFNRRFLLEMLGKELNQSARTRRPVGVILMDIDHFKSFNDTYGHAAGDVMLKALSDWLRAKTRRGDLVCRYGGEEFLVVMTGAPASVCRKRAQEWCDGFRELRIWHEDTLLHATLSLGAATSPTHGATPEDLIHAADMAMYAAKQAGRDCVRSPEDADGGLELSASQRQTA